MDGERAAILLHTTLKGAELLLDDAVRSGTDIALEHWHALRHGFAALLGHLTGLPAPSPGTDPGPGPRGADGRPSDALRRWVRGHRIFMVLIQGLVIAVDELADTVARAESDQAAEALDLAASLMRACSFRRPARSTRTSTMVRPFSGDLRASASSAVVLTA